jgi:Winged helix-turn helix
MEAGELLGMSERQFRRYRGRYEEDGVKGLVDQRLGKLKHLGIEHKHGVACCQIHRKETRNMRRKP